MNLKPGFDPERNSLTFILQVNFLDKYFSNLKGLLVGKDNLPKGIQVKRIGVNEAEISFPLPKNSSVDKEECEEGMIGKIAIYDADGNFKRFYETIQSFISSGMKKELNSYEFIPLNNYPSEDIIKDIKTANENKRGFCIIKDYEEFLRSQTEKTYIYTEYKIEYGSVEWADFLLETIGGNFDIKKLRKKYTPLLKIVNWM